MVGHYPSEMIVRHVAKEQRNRLVLVNRIFSFAFPQLFKCLGEMIVENDGFVSKLADQKIFLLNFALERKESVEFRLRRFERLRSFIRGFLGFQQLLFELLS